jgi:hypothetical protein
MLVIMAETGKGGHIVKIRANDVTNMVMRLKGRENATKKAKAI